MELLFAGVVVATAVFAFANGFHDAGVIVGNAVATRSLTPRAAVALCALFTFVGALLGQSLVVAAVAAWIDFPADGREVLGVLLAGVIAAVAWSIATYIAAIPVSATYCLVGGLMGAGLVLHGSVEAADALVYAIVPLILTPLLAVGIAAGATALFHRLAATAAPKPLFRRLRAADGITTGILAFIHGFQDAQKSMAVLVLAAAAAGVGAGAVGAAASGATAEEAVSSGAVGLAALWSDDPVGWWLRLLVAAAMTLGTALTGWRVAKKTSVSLVRLDPVKSVTANGTAVGLTALSTFVVVLPISFVYSVVGANIGTQLAGRRGIVRWRYAAPVIGAWAVTIPATAVLGAGCAALIAAGL